MTEQQSPTAAAASTKQMPAVKSRLHGMDEFTGKVRDMAAEWEADWNDPFPRLAQAYSLHQREPSRGRAADLPRLLDAAPRLSVRTRDEKRRQ
jgi:hypothetical protein